MENIIRSFHGPILGLLGFLIFLAVVALIALRFRVEEEFATDYKKWVKRVWLFLSLIAIAFFIWSLLTYASVNSTPRALIDRSEVKAQTDNFKKRGDDSYNK